MISVNLPCGVASCNEMYVDQNVDKSIFSTLEFLAQNFSKDSKGLMTHRISESQVGSVSSHG